MVYFTNNSLIKTKNTFYNDYDMTYKSTKITEKFKENVLWI